VFPVTFPELGGYEVFIDRVTGLLPPMELKRVYPGGRTTNAPLGLCQFGGAVVVDTVPKDVTLYRAVVPEVSGLRVSFPLEAPFFLFIGGHAVLVFAPFDVLAGGGPIPVNLGGFSFGIYGDVAGLAGNVLSVSIEMMDQKITSSYMGLVCVAVLTGKISFRSRYGNTAPGDHVVAGLVTILALEVHALATNAHMDIKVTRGFLESRAHIPVFDGIAAPTKEMAVHAASGPAWPAHILSDFHKIYVLFGKACPGWCLFVSPSGVMTNQTVDLGHVGKIKVLIFPTITNMAACTSCPV
jgi:hypothetical protein